jgi:threonine synthase
MYLVPEKIHKTLDYTKSMNITKALSILKDGLISDQDILNQIQSLMEEVSNSAYVAGIRDADSTEQVFTAYGTTQDWRM